MVSRPAVILAILLSLNFSFQATAQTDPVSSFISNSAKGAVKSWSGSFTSANIGEAYNGFRPKKSIGWGSKVPFIGTAILAASAIVGALTWYKSQFENAFDSLKDDEIAQAQYLGGVLVGAIYDIGLVTTSKNWQGCKKFTYVHMDINVSRATGGGHYYNGWVADQTIAPPNDQGDCSPPETTSAGAMLTLAKQDFEARCSNWTNCFYSEFDYVPCPTGYPTRTNGDGGTVYTQTCIIWKKYDPVEFAVLYYPTKISNDILPDYVADIVDNASDPQEILDTGIQFEQDTSNPNSYTSTPNANQWADDIVDASIDTDNDTHSDYWEDSEGYNPVDNSSFPPTAEPNPNQDSDGDGFNDVLETQSNSDPNNPASTPSDRDGDGYSNALETQEGSNPDDPSSFPTTQEPDADGDGFSDADENAAGSDPNNSASIPTDRDGDGFSNAAEATAGSNPDDPASYPGQNNGDSQDSDGDGYSDSQEQGAGTDPNDPSSYPATGGDSQDSDGDGWTDSEEQGAGTNPNDSSSFPSSSSGGNDSDYDGYTDDEEQAAGTDPNDPFSNPASSGESESGECGELACESTVQQTNERLEQETNAANRRNEALLEELGKLNEGSPAVIGAVPQVSTTRFKTQEVATRLTGQITSKINQVSTLAMTKQPFGMGGLIPTITGSVGVVCQDFVLTMWGKSEPLGWCTSSFHNFLSGTVRTLILAVITLAFGLSAAKVYSNA